MNTNPPHDLILEVDGGAVEVEQRLSVMILTPCCSISSSVSLLDPGEIEDVTEPGAAADADAQANLVLVQFLLLDDGLDLASGGGVRTSPSVWVSVVAVVMGELLSVAG